MKGSHTKEPSKPHTLDTVQGTLETLGGWHIEKRFEIA